MCAAVALSVLPGCYEGDPADFREAVVVGRDNVTALAIAGEVPVLEVGTTIKLTATATTGSGALDLSGDVSWRSSNPAAVMVDSDGYITAVANGSADITAELALFSDTVTIAASDAALQGITVSGDAAVDECGTGAYTASGHYDDGTDRDITALASWSVTDAAVARMSTLAADRSTLVSKLAGTTGVVASRNAIDSPAFVVTVADNLDAIDVTPNTPAQIAAGDKLQFTATGTWGLVAGPISRAATWSVASDDPDTTIATLINGDSTPGLLTAQAGGTGTVTGTCGGQSDSVDITVVYLDTLAITNTPNPVTIAPNATVLLGLQGTWSDGTSRTLNESATWSATLVGSTGTVVTVSNVAGTRGQVTAGSAVGVSEVTATVDGKTASVTVQVLN
ncbi:MAG: Ig-like domain-containing protein [Actinomycetota bacterium]|nr:Ig-like domain-containing protein [Actinomycetota bacterium]